MFGRRKARNGGEETGNKPLTVQERLELLESTEVLLKYPAGLVQPFSRQELGRLKKRFVHLIPVDDVGRELRLPLNVVLLMPELRAQPFVPLVARLFLHRQGEAGAALQEPKDGDAADELVTFTAFMTILAVFSVKQPLEIKRQVLFDVYDRESKGCATVDDFLRVISTISRSNAARQRVDDGRFSRTVIAFPPPDDDDSRMHLKQRDGLDFHFNDVFDPSISQEQVFNEVCMDIVYSALDGYNGTILAYGQTGSGKTYTITGGEHYADRGIIPRVLSTIFEEFEKRPNMRYSCYISYLEIYNENVYDLLDRSHTDRPIEEWTKVLLMDDDEGDMHFRNLGLGGNCKSVFIATLNPENDFIDESISTCRFMQRCSEVAVDIAVNTEVDTEKRLEAVEKLNAELEATNAELQARAVQLENEMKAQAIHFAKQEQHWHRRLTLAQEETQAAIAAAKSARDRSDQMGKKVDWMQCEEIVERLLLTGDLPREELDKPQSKGGFEKPDCFTRPSHKESENWVWLRLLDVW
ncbi:kinesin-like protein [Phytophthora cinnamomi]|uniref:kinesin-like protein n=1 Tax=Phytophthora cinnamomi TaxID=4785 RepID=UPI003559751E|nr:kinesin-like protein [Phytophthora cinnamomi]